jgi:GrpB-like predicted nucleotidyltransferase (UPF0157 family)
MVSDDERESRVIGGPTLHDDVINLADYDAAWPELFAAEEARIGAALAGLAIRVEHAGSTSVPGLAANVNVHVFSSGCPEADVMLAFRDHLRTNAADRSLHESAKRELASRRWTYGAELRGCEVRRRRRHHQAGDADRLRPPGVPADVTT